jgi:alkanesulfonate monooxygenase SsuD/methylene tetrahydromethanopterin reductase-like flavin-dependent oxidoreductase (luciferase family)
MQGRLADDLEDRNLVGTPDAVCEKVSRYAEAGVCTLAGLLFATDTVEATLDAMSMFAEEVVDSWTP